MIYCSYQNNKGFKMNNIFHKKLIESAMKITTFTGFSLSQKEIQTSDIELNFRFAETETVTILCDYHGDFKSLNTTSNKLLNSHLHRFVEIKNVLGLR